MLQAPDIAVDSNVQVAVPSPALQHDEHVDFSHAPVAAKAYVTWVGDGERWSAHVERSEDDPTGESSEHDTAADAVARARERSDWVLVVTEPLLWAGAQEKWPSEVHQIWRQGT
ncbi:hypothetical protein [Terrabacter sp. Ter38]|uniref:hypothetical protein n=1 Tax=Terrabacter sp. Ter38 TaxID=2926030 RepID=UPI00211864B0|nr:hypothetical protein [Terrabacter sp. Ter38]